MFFSTQRPRLKKKHFLCNTNYNRVAGPGKVEEPFIVLDGQGKVREFGKFISSIQCIDIAENERIRT